MVKKNSQRKTVSRKKTSKRKTSKRKTSKRKTSKRKTSKRKTSKRKTSKQRKSKRRVSRRKRVSNNKNQNGGQGLKDWFGKLRDKIDPPYKGSEEDQKKMKVALKRDVAMLPGVEYCDKGEKKRRGHGKQRDDVRLNEKC